MEKRGSKRKDALIYARFSFLLFSVQIRVFSACTKSEESSAKTLGAKNAEQANSIEKTEAGFLAETGADSSSMDAGDSSKPGPCGPGELLCGDLCVPNDQINCGDCGHDCTVLPHVIGPLPCANGECVATEESFESGWGNRSIISNDDRETGLSAPAYCGSCDKDCFINDAGQFCARTEATDESSASYQYVSECPRHAPTDYNGSCVDLNTSANHCGERGFKCPEIERGQVACGEGVYATLCNEGSHDCDGKCVLDTSPDSYGTFCEPCEAPLNSIPLCDGASCGFSCTSRCYLKCDVNTGCVPDDNRNCGVCGNDCTGKTKYPTAPVNATSSSIVRISKGQLQEERLLRPL